MSDDMFNKYPGDLLPRPDPTVLTTEQLRRELASLRELVEANLQGIRSRLDIMDKTADVLNANLNHIVSHRYRRVYLFLRRIRVLNVEHRACDKETRSGVITKQTEDLSDVGCNS